MHPLTAPFLALVPVVPAQPIADPAPPSPPLIEVVFVLDTTGSMSNLIEGAKARIWSIANRIADGDPVPDLRFGLVAYRDVGDEYVTRRTPLTADLDLVYDELMQFAASGGGDGPEHVNAALYDAVYAFGWRPDATLRLVFLVGDAPPHMDYRDGKDYRDICRAAAEKGIVINTIQCGSDPACAEAWRDIARRSEGRFTAVAQDGGMAAVETPVDARLAELSAELTRTHLGFGPRSEIERSEERKRKASAPPAAAGADKAEYSLKKAGYVAERDLVDALRREAVDLDELTDDELPPELRGLAPTERRARIAEIEEERARIVKEIEELSRRRQAFLMRAAQEKGKEASSAFDREVLGILREQAGRKGIAYPAPARDGDEPESSSKADAENAAGG